MISFLKSLQARNCGEQARASFNLQDAFLPTDKIDSSNNTSAYLEDIQDSIQSLADSIQLYSSYNSHTGVIPQPYLDYLIDIRLQYLQRDYVAFVTQETKHVNNNTYRSTVYNIFISSSLTYNGSSYSGSGILYKYYGSSNSYFPTYTALQDSSFSVSVGTGAHWSSLSTSTAPDFCRTSYGSYYCLFFMFFIFIYLCFSKLICFAKRRI